MKKLLLIIPALFLLVGCGAEKTGSISCNLSSNDVINNFSSKSEYKVNYKGDYATNVETTETVTSTSSDILDYFETTLNQTYTTMNNNYNGYTFKVSRENDTVISVVTIDYEKLNIEQLVKDQPTLKSYVKDNHFTVDGIKRMYEAMGATCE